MGFVKFNFIRLLVFGIAGAALAVVVSILLPMGYFGPLSARIRGLFVKHTRTGNPLVDSVAEHQPASQQAYFQYLHYLFYAAPIGFLMTFIYFGDAPSFLILYAVVAYFFSAKMVRLVLLLAPIASCLGGVFFGRIGSWSVHTLLRWFLSVEDKAEEETPKGKKGKKKSDKEEKKSSIKVIGDALKTASKSKEGNIL